MSKIRIAQIGTSAFSHGSEIFNTVKKADDIFEIVGYAMPENEKEKFSNRMEEFKGFRELTVDEILSDPTIDAVTVETEEVYLTKYAIMAAEHGKHIHMEKPGGINLADFEKLIKIVKRKNLIFHIGYMYRYNPVISHVIKEAANGLYGDIISVEAQMNCRHLEENRTWLKTFKGGMMFFLGCHLIDLVLRIQGMPNNVIPFNKSTGMNKVSAEDYGLAVFEYANGTSFVKTCDVEFGGFARRQLVITGTEGTVEIKPLEMFKGSGQYTGIRRFSSDAWSDMGEYKESKIFDRYEGMIRSFGQYVLGERKNPYSYDYELELYKTVLRCCGY